MSYDIARYIRHPTAATKKPSRHPTVADVVVSLWRWVAKLGRRWRDLRRAALAAAAALHAAHALPVRGASFSVKETMARRTLIIGLHRSIPHKRLRIVCCNFSLVIRVKNLGQCELARGLRHRYSNTALRGRPFDARLLVFFSFSCLQLRIWSWGIDQYGCCMSFGNNSIQEWFCSLDNYNNSSDHIVLSSAGKSWALLQIKRNRWAAGKYWWWVLVRGLGSESLIHPNDQGGSISISKSISNS